MDAELDCRIMSKGTREESERPERKHRDEGIPGCSHAHPVFFCRYALLETLLSVDSAAPKPTCGLTWGFLGRTR